MNYKKIFRNQNMRFKILDLFSFIPDKTMISIQYWLKLGRLPNLDEPKRFSEKMQWYKLNYRNDLLTVGADKYLVRDYVKSKNIEQILNKLYKVYNSVEEIDMNELPEKFVMKTTNGSGTNFFCTDKAEFDLIEAKNNINKWIKRDIYGSGREWAYKNITPKIIIEEYLEESDNQFEGISDYKFLCFHGNPEYIVFDVDRFKGHRRNIYDTNWNKINIGTDVKGIDEKVPEPKKLKEMLEIARILSEDFPFVRVDLYSINDRVYFGELTFYPWTGYIQFDPDEFDFTLGEKMNINNIQKVRGKKNEEYL